MHSVFAGISLQNRKYSFKRNTIPVPFGGVQCAFQNFNWAISFFEKSRFIYIYICTICIRSINDIEHPSQKCNMLETASIIKECSFASYNRILLKKQHLENWITCVWHVYYVLFPLVSPTFIYFGLERQLSLEEMWSVLSNSNASFESNISFISRGSCTKENNKFFKDGYIYSFKRVLHVCNILCSNNVSLS